MHIPKTLPVAIVIAVAGCDIASVDPGQFGEDEDAICAVLSREAVASDDQVEIGSGPGEFVEVVVSDAIAPAEGVHTSPLVWEATGETTSITATFGGATDVELVMYEYVGSEFDGGTPLVDPCPSRLEYTVAVELTSDDGRLAEAFTAAGWAFPHGIGAEAVIDTPAGTIDPVALSTSENTVQDDAIDVHLYVNPMGTPPFGGSISPVLADDPGGDVTVLTGWPNDSVE